MLKYLLGFALVFALAVCVAIKDEQATNHPTQKPQQASDSTISAVPDADQSQKDIENAKGNTPSWLGFFRWPNGTTTWAIFLTLLAIAEQTRETKRATDSQRDKERARLHVSPKYGEGFNEFDGEKFFDFTGPSVGVVITQHGPTKAFNVSGRWRAKIEKSRKHPAMRSLSYGNMNIPTVVDGDAPPFVADTIVFPFTPDDAEAVRLEKAFIHFFGTISYEDVFGKKQNTTFRYIWALPELMELPSQDGSADVEFVESEEAGWEKTSKDNYAT